MELKEFIKTAITDITEAVSELQEGLENGAIVSPSLPHAVSTKTIDTGGMHRFISSIDFDVALTIGNINTITGNAKAGIQILSAKMSGDNQFRTENVSRLTFSVPVIFPVANVRSDSEAEMEKSRASLRSMRASIQNDQSSDSE